MNYGYANGTIKAIESKMIDEATLLKFAKQNSQTILKALQDMGYGDPSAKDIEELVAYEMKKTRDLFTSIAPDIGLIALLFIENDINNVKLYWKKLKFDVDYLHLVVDSIAYPKDTLENIIVKKNFEGLSKRQRTMFLEMEESLALVDNPREVSTIIEQTMLAHSFAHAKSRNATPIVQYLKAFVDASNLKTLIRTKHLQWPKQVFESMLLTKGAIATSIFKEMFEEELAVASRKLMPYYHEMLMNILTKQSESINLDQLEVDLNMFLVHVGREFRHDSLTVGPMMYYFIEKQVEAKNIRNLFSYDEKMRTRILRY